MKKNKIIVLLVAFLFTGSFLLGQATEKKDISLEDIWLYYKFLPGFPDGFNWMKDDDFYTKFDEGKIVKVSIKDPSKKEDILDTGSLQDPDTKELLESNSYAFSKDESMVLLKSKIEKIYRYSSKEVCHVYDRKSKKVTKIHGGEQISFATFSHDASKLAYIYQNNLYVYDFTSEKQIIVTKDGRFNEIINGGTDWVYEEEFSFARAFFWSADSKKLAYYRFDESKVKMFSMAMYGSLYPESYDFKYPKAGEENSVVELYIYHMVGGKNVKVDLGTQTDQYIPRVKWTKDPDKLAVMRMNRLQNNMDLLLVEAGTGSSQVILTEQEESYIDEITDKKWIFLDNGFEFLWQSEMDGHNHVYLYGLDGKRIRKITSGNWSVTDISAVDEAKGILYYMSSEEAPTERHLYRITLEGKKKKKLTEQSGWHDVEFSSGNSYFMDSYSMVNDPGKSVLYTNKGKKMDVLEDNERLRTSMGKYNLSTLDFFSFKTSEDVELEGWMLKPPDFDSQKKYPVLMYVYGGPGSQTVKDQFGGLNYFWHQMLAEQGYIVISVDGRGTGGRGEDFKKATYGQLGKYEAIDQIETAKYIGRLDYVDKGRIGIWGWSFGGYMTSLVMTKGEGLFKMGIAVAPVTSWRYYDTIYTERYLKTPQLNPSGYDDNSPIEFAQDLKGNYLVVHGTADDNVHFQNSMEWVDALVKANKQFDMAFYPNKNHGIYGGVTRFHLYRKMTDYILENL